MPPIDEVTFPFCTDIEIADDLFHKRVSLDTLRAFTSYNARCKGIEDKFWEICVQNNSFQPYLKIYPNGSHTAEVGEKLQQADDASWKEACETDTEQAYDDYLAKFPNGVHVDDASWQKACKTDTEQAYDDYLTKFPKGAHVEDAYWQKACKINTEQSYNDYIYEYPEGKYVDEAERKRQDIIDGRQTAEAEAEKQQIIQEILEDPNRYSLPYLKSYWHITERDLREEFVRRDPDKGPAVLKGWDLPEPNIVMGQTPERIPRGLTEVYFWGVPGSGKTCALGAILGAASRLGVYKPRVGENGLGYMKCLTNAFTPKARQSVIHLPPATQSDSTQYLPITLNVTCQNKGKEQKIIPHDLAIIDLSGEIFRCFAKVAAGEPFGSPAEESVYNTVCNYLTDTRNPKYHFFVLDSNPSDNAQHNDLQIAAAYFEKSQIFNKNTCDISLIVTKCDTLSPNRADWVACAEKLVNDSFSALANQLKYIVGQQLGLTDGTLDVIPLSLGDVFFQQLCLFDPQPANELVKRLMAYSIATEKKSRSWKKYFTN